MFLVTRLFSSEVCRIGTRSCGLSLTVSLSHLLSLSLNLFLSHTQIEPYDWQATWRAYASESGQSHTSCSGADDRKATVHRPAVLAGKFVVSSVLTPVYLFHCAP